MSKLSILSQPISIASALAIVAFAVWWSVIAEAADDQHSKHHDGQVQHMAHIGSQADAETLKPGDSLAMACCVCRHVTVYPVSKDGTHVKLMTIGEKHKCICGGTVTVVGTGKGKGKQEQVNHVCSKCGKDAMFACATKPSSSSKTITK